MLKSAKVKGFTQADAKAQMRAMEERFDARFSRLEGLISTLAESQVPAGSSTSAEESPQVAGSSQDSPTRSNRYTGLSPRDDLSSLSDQSSGTRTTPPVARSRGAKRSSERQRGMQVHQVPNYSGSRLTETSSHRDVLSVLKQVHQYKASNRTTLPLREVCTEGLVTRTVTEIRAGRVSQRDTSMDDLKFKSHTTDGTVLAHVLEPIRPRTPQAYQKLLTGVRYPGSDYSQVMITQFVRDVQTPMSLYVDEFVRMWSLLRFSKDVYDSGPQGAANLGAAKVNPDPDIEPTLLEANTGLVKVLKRQESPQELLGLCGMFLSGMPGNSGNAFFSLFKFHTRTTKGDKTISVKSMDFMTFIERWREAVNKHAEKAAEIAPLLRAMANLRPKAPPHKSSVAYVSDEEYDLNEVATTDREGPKGKFCLALLLGTDCSEGSECPFDHSREAFHRFRDFVNSWRPEAVRGYAPSKQRKKKLAYIPGAAQQRGKPPMALVKRPPTVISEIGVQDPEEQASDSESEVTVAFANNALS